MTLPTDSSSNKSNFELIIIIVGLILSLGIISFFFYYALISTSNNMEQVVVKNKEDSNKDIIHAINEHENLLDKLKREIQSNAHQAKTNTEDINNLRIHHELNP
jgi:F0F1-type ATP synthase membrane subunit b/b'